MRHRALHQKRGFFARQQLMAVFAQVRQIFGLLGKWIKLCVVLERGAHASAVLSSSDETRIGNMGRQSGGCHRTDGLQAEGDNQDLLEKNEYLRTATEEVIKLTQSLEEANAELEKTRDYLTNLIQNSADMIVSTGRRRTITLFNRRAEEVLGYRSDEVVGHSIDILYEPGEMERVEKLLKQEPDGKLMEHEIRLRTKGGVIIPARLTASLLYDRRGNLMGSVGACTDLTHVKALEDELLKQQKLLAIAELGGAASHELNQPLTVALGRIQLIFRRDRERCPYYQDLLHVERELEKMATMVRRIGRITRYKTKPYIGQSRIIDLDKSVAARGDGGDDLRQESRRPP